MKILFVTTQFGRSYAQGTERYLSMLGDGLRTRGHEVSYLAGDPLHLDRPLVLGEPVGGPAADLFAYPTRGWMAVMGIAPRQIERWLRAHRPDVVHVANPAHVGVGVMPAARALGLPVVVTTMDFWWVCPKATLLRADGSLCDGTPDWRECTRCIGGDYPRPAVRRLSRLPPVVSPLLLHLYHARSALRGVACGELERWKRRREVLFSCLNAAQQIIFPSSVMRTMIAPRLTHRRWRMIPYGLTPSWFERPRPAREQAVAPERLTVGFAGAMLPHKGPHLLLEAVRRLGWTRTRVRMAGPFNDPAYAKRLHHLADGLNVEFTGLLSAERMPSFLRGLDVLAMPSVWPENLPFIVLEAQAAGVPVVASDVEGVADQVGDARLRFEAGSAEGLAAALEHVRQHPETVPAARVRTIDEMTDETLAVYETSKIETSKWDDYSLAATERERGNNTQRGYEC